MEAQNFGDSKHIPVMTGEVVRALRADEGGAFLDCTLGGGGHTKALLDAHPDNRVTSVDRDDRAVKRAQQKLAPYGARSRVLKGTFSSLGALLAGEQFKGAVADLGLSTDQLGEERGFSFQDNSPLDMRMDESADLSADDVINNWDERELFKVLKVGGVGQEAHAVARAIVRARPIEDTAALSAIINRAAAGLRAKKATNPSTVIFQAIRIAVNREFEEIESLLDQAQQLLAAGGRLGIISFHSSEDKIVASRMRAWESAGSMPALWPGPRSERPRGRLLSKKAIVASEEEVERNPSARSARLRVFEFRELGAV